MDIVPMQNRNSSCFLYITGSFSGSLVNRRTVLQDQVAQQLQYLYGRSLQDWFQSGLIYVRPESDLSSLETSF